MSTYQASKTSISVPHRSSKDGELKPHYVSSTSIDDMIESKLRFRIPTIQRPYVWDAEKAVNIAEETWRLAQLWGWAREHRDSAITVDAEVPAIFSLGAATVVDSEELDQVVDVIDGQQRITTLTCLVAALRTTVEDLSEKDKEFKQNLTYEFVNLVRTKQTASRTNDEAARRSVGVSGMLTDFLSPKDGGEHVPRLFRETSALDDSHALEVVSGHTDFEEGSPVAQHPIFSSYRVAKRLFSAEKVKIRSGIEFSLESYKPSPRNVALLAAALLYGVRLALVAENPTSSALEHIDRFITINTQAEPLAGFDIVKGHVMRDHSADAAAIDDNLRRIYTFLENSLSTGSFDREKTQKALLEEFPELANDQRELSFRLAEEEAFFNRKPRAKVNATVDNYLTLWLHSSTKQPALVPRHKLAACFGDAVNSPEEELRIGSGLSLAKSLKDDLKRIHDLSSNHQVFSASNGASYIDVHITNMCATNSTVKQHLALVFALRKLPPEEIRPAVTAVVGYVGMHALFGTLAQGEARAKLFEATQAVVSGDVKTSHELHRKLFRDQDGRLTVRSERETVDMIKALDYNNASKKMKFILLTIENHMRLQENSANEPQLKLSEGLDLDHIMPLAAAAGDNPQKKWLAPVSGEPGTVTHLDSLGNLCLLEKSKNQSRGSALISTQESADQYRSSDVKLAGITYEGRDSKNAFSVKAGRAKVTLLDNYPVDGAGSPNVAWTPRRAAERTGALASMFWNAVVAPPITPLSYSNADSAKLTVDPKGLILEGLLVVGEPIYHEQLDAGVSLLSDGNVSYAGHSMKLSRLASTALKGSQKGSYWERGFFVMRDGEKRMLASLKEEYLALHKALEEEPVTRELLFSRGGSMVEATEHLDGSVEFKKGSVVAPALTGKLGVTWEEVYEAGVLDHTDAGYRFNKSYSFPSLTAATVFITGSAEDVKRWEPVPA